MKVLHVIPSVAARYGGPSLAVGEMCKALGERGVDTLIATTDADGEGRLAVELGSPTSYQGVPSVFFSRQWSEAFKYSRPLAGWLHEHVSDFDVVHIHAVFSHSSLAAASACRKHGVPYIVRPLGTLDPWSLKQKGLKKKLFWHIAVRRMLEGASAIHYTTKSEMELAQDSLGLLRGLVVPLGINIPSTEGSDNGQMQQDFEPLATSRYVLMLSRLHPKKGLELLLAAFLSLVRKPEFEGWKLALAGDGDPEYVASLRALVEKENGNEHIVFTGWLDGLRKESALRGAALLALTSYQENFGLCVIEALAYGVPVLVSPQVNLSPEIAASGAGWVAELNQAAIEQKLAEALSDESERRDRGAAGRDLVTRRFAWSAVASQMIAIYAEVARESIETAVAHA